jgi:LacI family transcriptional regulator
LGYQDSLVSHGLEFRQELLAVGMPVFEHGYAGARKILTEHPEVTALFCYNDLIAMGALRACKDLRKRVPRDCAIIGFDNNRFSALTDPALTTVHIDKYEIGKQAACRLLDMLKEPTLTFPAIHFDAELIVRESA